MFVLYILVFVLIISFMFLVIHQLYLLQIALRYAVLKEERSLSLK